MKISALPTRAEDMVCYGVYTAAHVINRAYTPLLTKLGLTYPQYITLTLLWECDGQRVTELAEKLRMGTNTLTPLIKRLEAQNLVERSRDTHDSRAICIRLTSLGRALQSKAPDVTACMVNATTLTRNELCELQRLLEKLSGGLTAK